MKKYGAFRARQVTDAAKSDFTERKPTEVTETSWIFASRKAYSNPKPTERSGKWLLFTPVEKIDETWAVIKAATEAGKLGPCSKVATMRPNPNAIDSRNRVICIGTYDSEDRADVNRVRQALRELGFVEDLRYKTDEATMEGRYGKTRTPSG
jgi:hypothetical protein